MSSEKTSQSDVEISSSSKNKNFKETSANQQTLKQKPTEKKSLKEHKNPIVRAFAKVGYTAWIVVLSIGGILAFLISLVAL